MKTDKELLKQYYEMLTHTKVIHDIVQNPPSDYTFDKIKEAIQDEREQLSMNDLIEWVLGITKNKKYKINEHGLIPCCIKGDEVNGEIEMIDCDVVFMEDLTFEQINEFYENGFVQKHIK